LNKDFRQNDIKKLLKDINANSLLPLVKKQAARGNSDYINGNTISILHATNKSIYGVYPLIKKSPIRRNIHQMLTRKHKNFIKIAQNNPNRTKKRNQPMISLLQTDTLV